MAYQKMKKKSYKKILNIFLATAIISTSFSPSFANTDLKPVSYSYDEQEKQSNYTFEELNKMSYKELIDVIENCKWTDIDGLFKYSKECREFFTDENRINALREALENEAKSFTKEDDKGIVTMIEVLRSGMYLGFYHDDMKELSKRSFYESFLPAMHMILDNKNFGIDNNTQCEIAAALGVFANNACCDLKVVDGFSKILKTYQNNFDEYNNPRANKAIFNIMQAVEYDLQKLMQTQKLEDTIYFHNINSFINELGLMLENLNFQEKDSWLKEACIYYAGKLAPLHTDKEFGLKTLTNAMKKSKYLSLSYLEAAKSIDQNYNKKDADGNTVDFKELIEQAKKEYYPNKDVFDSGEIVIKSGKEVSKEKINRMYWATKEVRSQFHRMVNTDEALEKGNKDDVLTIIIYNNKKEYEANRIINGLSTDNGGIYIEGDGTFYTWDREVPQDSIFDLEELFRHEFTHYLQGRYVVPGIWGQTPIYQNNRLTWYEEGGAEFFAGSTRLEGVKPRKTIYNTIANYEKNDRYHLNQVIGASYDNGWDFYNYSCAYMDYMNKKDWNMFNEITKTIQSNDVKALDKIMKNYKNDDDLDREYRNHTNKLVDNLQNMDTVLVSKDYLRGYEKISDRELFDLIGKVLKTNKLDVQTKESKDFNTVIIRSDIELESSFDDFKDFKKLENYTDGILKELSKQDWKGFKTYTGYFVDRKIVNGKLKATIVLHGIFTDDANVKKYEKIKDIDIDKPEEPKNKNPFKNYIKEESEDNYDFENASGKLANDITYKSTLNEEDSVDTYAFEVEKDSKINIKINSKDIDKKANFLIYKEDDKENPIDYAEISKDELSKNLKLEKGKYYLRVYKYVEDDIEYKLKVDGDIGSYNKESDEKEPFENIKEIKHSLNEKIFLDQDKNQIVYKIEAKNLKTIDVTLNLKNEKSNLNWVIFSKNNLNDYYAYGIKDGSSLKNRVSLDEGTYYIVIYNYDKEPEDAIIEIN